MPLMNRRTLLQPFRSAAAGDGDASGGGAPAAGPSNEDLQRKVDSMATQIQTMNEGFTNALSMIAERLATPAPPANDTPTDLEAMSREEFLGHIQSTLVDRLKKELISPVEDQVTGLSRRFDSRIASDELTSLKASAKDFIEWKDEVVGILTDSPNMRIQDAYILARGRNPSKAAQLDQKYNPPRQRVDDIFTGFTPGGSKTTGHSNMKPRQAAEAAWDSMVDQLNQT